MLSDVIRENREVVLRAIESVRWKRDRANTIVTERYSGNHPPFDHRNIPDIASLIIDLDDVPDNEKEAYFDRELNNIIEACEGKGDIGIYIKKMYDKIAIDENIDWSNQKQIENLFATARISQALATVFCDFKKQTLDLYKTHAQTEILDARIAKSLLLYFKVAELMNQAGLAEEVDARVNMGLRKGTGLVTDSSLVKKDACDAIFDANLNGGRNEVIINPLNSENAKSFFLKRPIHSVDEDGDVFTDDDYGREFIRAIATAAENSSLEQLMVNNIQSAVPERNFSYENFLFINGKSFSRHSEELAAKAGVDPGLKAVGDKLAGKMLREALTDGKSVVTLLRMNYNDSGKMKFYHQNIKVDLDALNEADRNENHYNFFRWILHKLHLWKIQKYPSNASRDARLAKEKDKPQYQKAIRETEDRILELYNGIVTYPEDIKDLTRVIPKLTRDDAPDNTLSAPTLENNENREHLSGVAVEEHISNIPTQPKYENKPKELGGDKLAK